MTDKHIYLFAIEVAPMEVGAVYDELPLHCTLMHRFWSNLAPESLADKVRPFLERTNQVVLSSGERLLLGPNQVAVNEIEFTDEIRDLHMHLYRALNDLGVEYTAPQWVGEGYKAHVTERRSATLATGKRHLGKAVYLIEVENHKRVVRARFVLSN